MRVGVNYPWVDYGWDFGPAPPSWRQGRTMPRWTDVLDGHLDRFQSLGVTVVRWFILADGLTYGTGSEAPWPDPVAGGTWRFEPPQLHDDTLQHFDEALRRFAAVRDGLGLPIQVIPVLLDFHFCGEGVTPVLLPDTLDGAPPGTDPGWVKRGRAEALIDPAARERLLDRVLDPLLEVSSRHGDVIFAWELMNEPDLITTGWHASSLVPRPIDAGSMRAFLEGGGRRIRRAGFKTTIGFASIRGLRRSGITADINQFHHYASGRHRLDPHPFDARYPGIIGEFATAATDVWPDLVDQGQSVLNRLRLAEALGYPLAMPWAFLSEDRHTRWDEGVERDLRLFAAGTA